MRARSTAVAATRPSQLVPWLLAALLLAGCQSVPKAVTPAAAPEQVLADWPARRALLQARSRFTTQGRIGVVAGKDGFSGHLRWVQDAARSTVSLEGPLGVGGVRITDEAGQLTLTTPSGAALDSQAAHDELVRRMGFEPPLASLRYWIQGVPDPATPATETLDAQGHLGALVQGGWTVTFSAYLPTAAGFLPQRLSVERETVRLKLVLDGWQSP